MSRSPHGARSSTASSATCATTCRRRAAAELPALRRRPAPGRGAGARPDADRRRQDQVAERDGRAREHGRAAPARRAGRRARRASGRLRIGVRSADPFARIPERSGRPQDATRRRPDQYVIAVQLDLDTAGFTFRKWGAEQRVQARRLARRQRRRRLHRRRGQSSRAPTASCAAAPTSRRRRCGPRRARRPAASPRRRAARTTGRRLLVSNDEDGSDAYAVDAAKFEAMYEPDE